MKNSPLEKPAKIETDWIGEKIYMMDKLQAKYVGLTCAVLKNR